MRKNITLFLFLTSALFAFSQNARTTITITAKETSVVSYTDKEVILNGPSNLHLTASTNSLRNSIIKLNSENSWVFFDNIKPSLVADSLLQYFTINGYPAANKTNVRVSIYKHGAVVIPHPSTFQPLRVFTGQNFSGDSTAYSLFTLNSALGSFDNKIRSFKLKRGYMATLANSSDGTGFSRVFIADDQDLEVPVLPNTLDNTISFTRVLDWEWVTKKGWCGTGSGGGTLGEKVNGTWFYSWSADQSSKTNLEYVPIKQNMGWPGWSEISGKQNVSHVLGYNEPDHTEQSNVTVAQAVAAWPDMLKTGLRVGSPACTNFGWLYEFMDSCKAKNYRVDYVAVHAYWGDKSPQNWYNDLKYIHERTGRPIWITEWNNGANWTKEWWPADWKSQQAKQLADITKIIQVLDTAHFIERYSIYNWVEDKRALVLADTLTPAGKFYAANKSVMAYNKMNEVIPTFSFGDPSLSIAFSTKKLTLNLTDPNDEYYRGFILEKKIDNGSFEEFYRVENTTIKNCQDTIDINAFDKVRYRARTILLDGSLSGYTNEVGFDVTTGGNVQYGNLSFSNVDWNTVFFKKPFTSIPAIILGTPSNKNSSVLLSARAKLINKSTSFKLQLAPWTYQNVSSLAKEENTPYFILNTGNYNFGGLMAKAGLATVASAWTAVTFTAPFDAIPVVFTTQLNPLTVDATTVRVRNVTKTGFEARLQKETKVKLTPASETVSYFAITQGSGLIDNNKIIVGKTADNAISTTSYTTINFGDSIANPVFLAQMQTCNDDTVTATLRCLSISSKYANVMKQREKSTGSIIAGTESAGWMVIKPVDPILGLNTPSTEKLKLFPNPVKDLLYLSQNNAEELNAEILNMFGVLVMKIHVVNNQINVSDLLPGCYVLKTSKYGSNKFIKL